MTCVYLLYTSVNVCRSQSDHLRDGGSVFYLVCLRKFGVYFGARRYILGLKTAKSAFDDFYYYITYRFFVFQELLVFNLVSLCIAPRITLKRLMSSLKLSRIASPTQCEEASYCFSLMCAVRF